ncbi:Hypothetical predicted protein, partial [Paramuricea clavata]
MEDVNEPDCPLAISRVLRGFRMDADVTVPGGHVERREVLIADGPTQVRISLMGRVTICNRVLLKTEMTGVYLFPLGAV